MPLSRAVVFIFIQLAAAVAATKFAGMIGVDVASTFAGVDMSATMLRNVWLEYVNVEAQTPAYLRGSTVAS